MRILFSKMAPSPSGSTYRFAVAQSIHNTLIWRLPSQCRSEGVPPANASAAAARTEDTAETKTLAVAAAAEPQPAAMTPQLPPACSPDSSQAAMHDMSAKDSPVQHSTDLGVRRECVERSQASLGPQDRRGSSHVEADARESPAARSVVRRNKRVVGCLLLIW